MRKKNEGLGESGVTLVITLMMLLVLILIGVAALLNSSVDLRISGNERVQKKAFYSADAGLNFVRSSPAVSAAVGQMTPANPPQSQTFSSPEGSDTTFQGTITYGISIVNATSPLRDSPNPVWDTNHNPILFKGAPPALSKTGIRTGVKAHYYIVSSTGSDENQAQKVLAMQSYKLGYAER